ncbi:hndD [Scenedesmus sp. PABB004]|nr:hndD [Scenedesmus sp. PABB004]
MLLVAPGAGGALAALPGAAAALARLLPALRPGQRAGAGAGAGVSSSAAGAAGAAPPAADAAGVSSSAAGAAAPAPLAADAAPLRVTVNGRPLEVPAGSSVYQAVKRAGGYVPVLCKHPKLDNTPGACRRARPHALAAAHTTVAAAAAARATPTPPRPAPPRRRVCMVEADGRLRASCCTPAADGMVINTDTPEAKHVITGTLALLRANHPEDCMACDANGRCEFQDLITRYNVPKWPKLKEVSEDYQEHSATWTLYDQSSPAIRLDLEKCIKCSRCVTTCEEVQGMNVLGMFNRGRDRHIGFVHESEMELSKCIDCGQCVSVCPVGALYENTHWRQVLEALQDKRKVMVVQTAPAVRVAIGEEVGLAPGAVETGQMVAGLRALGFDYVFDTDFAADLTIMEEATELLGRLKAAWGLAEPAPDGSPAPPLPMFTSCCPAWINLVEADYPDLLPHLSSCKSPQQMMGSVVKAIWAKRAGVKPEDVCFVSVMPCVAKKEEAARPEMGRAGYRDIDYVLTTRELGRLFRHLRIPVASLPAEPYDSPLGTGSGAAVLFGNTGGVMEAAVRTAVFAVTGKELATMHLEAVRGLKGIKEAALDLEVAPGLTKQVRVAVASGVANARRLVEEVRAGRAHYDFVEVMSCPGGCIGGGGQPKTRGPDVLSRRMAAVYGIDDRSTLRQSHNNADIKELYASELGSPNGHTSHELLHTTYTDRSAEASVGYSAAAREAAEVPPEITAAREASTIPGPPGGWHFQPLFRRQAPPDHAARPRRQAPAQLP